MIEIDGKTYKVNIHYKKMKSITLRVRQGQIEVNCPYYTDHQIIYDLIMKNKKKIVSSLDNYQPYYELKDKGYIYLFDQKYEIKVVDMNKYQCVIHGDKLYVYHKNVEKAVSQFCGQFLYDYIKERVSYYCKLMGLKEPSILIRYYKSRWGSCYYEEGRVSFNSVLVHLKKPLIDSVVVHELAHFYVPNHSKKFYDIVYTYMKDYDYYHDQLKGKNI